MKRKESLFKKKYSDFQYYEDALDIINSNFIKILRIDLKKNTFQEIKVLKEEKLKDKGYSNDFFEWGKNFAMTGNIHKDDISAYLDFINIENLKKKMMEEQKKYSIKYRRLKENSMRWSTLEFIPEKNFSEKRQIVYMFVRDIHETLSEELNTSKLMTAIAHSITKSSICSVYLDLESNYSKLIYAQDYVRQKLDITMPLADIMRLSISNFASKPYQEQMFKFTDLDTISERLRGKNKLTMEYIGSNGNFLRACFIPVICHSDGRVKSIVYSTEYIEGEIINLRGQLKTEKTLVDCLTTLSSSDNFDEAIHKLLGSIGDFYNADRAYIFNIDYIKNTTRNEYEWCKEGVTPEIENLQNIPLEYIDRWFDLFNKYDCIKINSVGEELKQDSPEAKILNSQGIKSLFAIPIRDSQKKITGFIGIDNPAENLESEIVLRTVNTYIAEEKIKKTYTDELYQLSYSDSMTNTYNRAAYMRDMNNFSKMDQCSLGILYADVNGLKVTNDTMGHEAGDKLISDAVTMLKKYFYRKADSIYRLGGDEFVVLSSDISQMEFYTRVANLKDELNDNWIMSCGGKWFSKIEGIDQSTNEAEKSMYQNKADYYRKNPRTDRRQ